MHLRTFFVATGLLIVPAALQAVGPIIGVDRDPPGATPVTGTGFSFGANSNGGGDFAFINESGQAWKELSIFTMLTTQTPTPVCFAGPFRTCSVAGAADQFGNVSYMITFGTGQFVGIPQGEGFTLNLNDQGTDPSGSGSWPAGQDFTATANDVSPEPSPGLLTLSGALVAGVVWFYRRRALS